MYHGIPRYTEIHSAKIHPASPPKIPRIYRERMRDLLHPSNHSVLVSQCYKVVPLKTSISVYMVCWKNIELQEKPSNYMDIYMYIYIYVYCDFHICKLSVRTVKVKDRIERYWIEPRRQWWKKSIHSWTNLGWAVGSVEYNWGIVFSLWLFYNQKMDHL